MTEITNVALYLAEKYGIPVKRNEVEFVNKT